jgi:predicted GNAT family acetyltransferase
MTLLQMVADKHIPDLNRDPPELVRLGPDDVDEMLALTELTRPGPFGRRTIEMGDYSGLREQGRLVAMAGERLALPGLTEVSAVCVHPELQGRGLAASLVHAVASRIQARGETPFLHSAKGSPSFERARGLYRAMGFRERRTVPLTLLLRV